MDMGLKDYDSRSALHIAAAEGERRMTILSVCERKKKKPSFSMDAVIHGHFSPKTPTFLICLCTIFKMKSLRFAQ